jgi:hypothetical protein
MRLAPLSTRHWHAAGLQRLQRRQGGEPVHAGLPSRCSPDRRHRHGDERSELGAVRTALRAVNSSSTFALGRLVTIDKDFNIADLANTANLGRPVAVVLSASRRAT